MIKSTEICSTNKNEKAEHNQAKIIRKKVVIKEMSSIPETSQKNSLNIQGKLSPKPSVLIQVIEL
jgi:hypothetical protein